MRFRAEFRQDTSALTRHPEMNTSKKNKRVNNNKTFHREHRETKIRKYFKLVHRKIFPCFTFKLKHNAKYSMKDFLNVLVHAARSDMCSNEASEDLRKDLKKKLRGDYPDVPHGNTVLYHLRSYDEAYYKRMYLEANAKILKIAKSKGFFKGKVDVAIDYTDQPFYGNKNTRMVLGIKRKKSTSYGYKYATINIVKRDIRFTLYAMPIRQGLSHEKVVKELIDYASTKVDIGTVCLDKEFFTKDVIRLLDNLGIKFVMPAVRNKRVLREIKGIKPAAVLDYTMGAITRKNKVKFKDPVTFKLVVAILKGKKRVYATNLDVTDKDANWVAELYRTRWGIETSYRSKNRLRATTTSKNYNIRLFLFLFSVCLYNLWVLVNAFMKTFVFNEEKRKLHFTAKIFGKRLIDESFYIDDGG